MDNERLLWKFVTHWTIEDTLPHVASEFINYSGDYFPFANMVLDIDAFRPEKGGNPEKIRENQKKRFCDVSMVDKIVAADEDWRKGNSVLMENWGCNSDGNFPVKILLALLW